MNLSKEQVLGLSIIENKIKVFIKQGTISNQSQQSQTTNNNVPDINNREGDIVYYKFVEKNNLDNSEIVDSSNQRAFYEGWKQGNNYYIKVNTNISNRTLIQRPNSFLDPLFEYKKDSSATKIKNIKPAVFDLSTKELIQKGQVELS